MTLGTPLMRKESIVTYVDFDCGNTLYPKTAMKIRQINREQNYIYRSCEKPKCIPSSDQHNCSFDKQHSSNIFLNPYNLWDVVQQLLCHSTTLMIDALCPISTLTQQFTNLEQTQILCSLHCEQCTVKEKDCTSALRSFKEITYRMDE